MLPDIKIALGFDDRSRKEIDTTTQISRNITIKYPLIASPMDTISDVEMCICLNKMGAAGILHRFMSIEHQVQKAKNIKNESGKCYVAVGLKDSTQRMTELNKKIFPDLFFLDTANGSSILVEEFTRWAKETFAQDIIVGNTLTKESVRRLVNLGADGFRSGIGGGSVCVTSLETGVGCPHLMSNYYGWKAIRNWYLEKKDLEEDNDIKRPSLLVDGGIRYPSDLVKSIVSGADAVICGSIFAGCKETPGIPIRDKQERLLKKYRGMASKEVVEDYEIWDGTPENLFVEGEERLIPYRDISAQDIVFRFVNGLRSAMSYLNFCSIDDMRGSLWTGKTLAVRITANSLYERQAHK